MADKAEQRTTVQTALDRFKLSRDTFEAQRKRETDDLMFQVPELQWDKDALAVRKGGDVVGGVTIPARPHLSIPKLDQPIQLIINQMKQAHLGVQIHPVSEDASKDTAQMLQGLYRHIERDSKAHQARTWAFDRAVKAGLGYYRVNTVWDDTSSHPFDQKISIERILDQDLVYLDPSAQQASFADMEWAFVATWLPIDRYRRDYPDSDLARYDDDALRALVQRVPEWVRLDGPKQTAVLVAEYWRREYTTREWVQLLGGGFGYRDEVDPTQIDPGGLTRTVRVPKVLWSVINGHEEVTDPQEWNGKFIPIVVVAGRELQPFDGERRWVGMIRNARDGQRLYNYAASNSVEIAANEPRAPWLLYEGQDEGYEEMWAQANVRNFPVLKFRATTVAGQPVPPPQRVTIDGTRLGVSMQLLAQADQYIQSSTAVFDPSLGRVNNTDRSGRAVLALQQQSDAGNSHFLDNLATIAMEHEARIVLDLMPAIYDRPGRVVQLLSGEDEQSPAMIGAPYRLQDGRAVPVEPGPAALDLVQRGPGAPWGMSAQQTRPQPPPAVKQHDLRKGAYGVSVSVGRSFQTRLEEGSAEIGQLLQAAPQLLPLLGPVYFKFRDFPGSQEISDLLKKMRSKEFPGLDETEDGDPRVQLQQLQGQMQAMQQQLQQAEQYIAKDQAKVEGQVAIEREKARLQLELQAMKNAATIEVAKIQAITKGVLFDGQIENEQQALGAQLDATQAQQHQQHAHDVGMAHLQAVLSQQQAQAAQQHEMQQTQAGQQFDAQQADMDRQASLAQQLAAPQDVPPMSGGEPEV